MYHVTYCKVECGCRSHSFHCPLLLGMWARVGEAGERGLCLLACLLACTHLLPCSLLPRSLLAAEYRYRYGPWYRYWGRGPGTWVPDTWVGPRGQSGSPSLGREAGVQVGQAGRPGRVEVQVQVQVTSREQQRLDGAESKTFVPPPSALSCVPPPGSPSPFRALPCPPALQARARAAADHYVLSLAVLHVHPARLALPCSCAPVRLRAE